MAIESPALCNSLLSLASSHISLVDGSYAVATLEAQNNAIKNLTSSINAPSNQMIWHETNAATCLALATSQISTSNGNGWLVHLQGAKHFITSAATHSGSGEELCGLDAFKMTPEGRWILRNFAYHDIIGSVTLGNRPILGSSYVNEISNGIDSYLGVATSLLSYIGEITSLEDDTPAEDLDETFGLLFLAQCAQIEEDLQNWTCPADAEESLAAMANAYRSVALILLYRLIRRRFRADQEVQLTEVLEPTTTESFQTKIEAQVVETLRHVSDVPVGAPAEAALLFPLFIAGGEARDEIQIDIIRARLEVNLRKRNFQNISHSLRILEDLWFQRQVFGIESADWVQILEASGEELVLT